VIKFEESCGNVFEDLGLPNSRSLKEKSDVVIRIQFAMLGKDRSQVVSNLGISEKELNDILRGKFAKMSLIRLEEFENKIKGDRK